MSYASIGVYQGSSSSLILECDKVCLLASRMLVSVTRSNRCNNSGPTPVFTSFTAAEDLGGFRIRITSSGMLWHVHVSCQYVPHQLGRFACFAQNIDRIVNFLHACPRNPDSEFTDQIALTVNGHQLARARVSDLRFAVRPFLRRACD